MPQERRSYSKSFKAQVIAECAQADTSIANVALTHNLNANLVHKWIRVHAQKNLALQTAFIPVKAAPSIAKHQALPATIRIEVPHPKGVVVVSWPTENTASCSAFLRDLLR
ncbi:transposase [Pseudomonas salomonii]|uniref:Transposase n=1 Tax=Pseudomonas salomonii TaxID=191391 RepID=A0A7Y8KMI5_9PSED|nr:transposase [Pseudomonas salomonii]NWF07131.1 transposase [Pseudomonas salomonii]OPA89643.1 transposase [Pseudomonas fluorescens]